jgi:hypothetical protein
VVSSVIAVNPLGTPVPWTATSGSAGAWAVAVSVAGVRLALHAVAHAAMSSVVYFVMFSSKKGLPPRIYDRAPRFAATLR